MSRQKVDPSEVVRPTLTELLNQPGEHVWRFKHTTTCETVEEACRRLTGALHRKPKVRAVYYGHVLVNPKPPYDSEPVLIIQVRHV